MDDISPPPSSSDEEGIRESHKKRMKLLEKARECKKRKKQRALVS